MAQTPPSVSWKRVDFDPSDGSIIISEPDEKFQPNGSSYNPKRPLWNAGIVEAGDSTEPEKGIFMLWNNRGGISKVNLEDIPADMINVRVSTTDVNGGQTDKRICGDNASDRQATVYMTMWDQTANSGTGQWGWYDRANVPFSEATNWKDGDTSTIPAGTLHPIRVPITGSYTKAVHNAQKVALTFSNYQLINNAAHKGAVGEKGGTICGHPNFGSAGLVDTDNIDYKNANGQTNRSQGDPSKPAEYKEFTRDNDHECFALLEFTLQAENTADAGTVEWIIRASYQYQ